MTRTRAIALASGTLIVAVIAALILFLPFAITFGAPFKLTAHDGRVFDSATLAGRPYAIVFGFTNCPDVCPTTLLDLTNHLEHFGAKAGRLAVLFVTVDPERDTPGHLARYMQSFDKRIIALTGHEPEIKALARSFRATFRRVPTGDGYTLDHTTSVFLMDKNGIFSGTLSPGEAQSSQRAKLQALVAE